MARALVALALALGLVACASGESGTPDPSGSGHAPCRGRGVLSDGEPLPSCTFEGMRGQPDLVLDSLAGRPAILNFWASWCTYCIEEMPDFQRVHASLGERVTFVGMNVLGVHGETRGAAETFRDKTGVEYRLAFDPEGRLYEQFQPNVQRPVLPITVFVDDRGTVARKHFGPLTAAELRRAIRETLGVTA